MYSRSAAYYDAIYGTKDYEAEARTVHKLIWTHRRSAGRMLLDVACGTGRHLEHLQHDYIARGLDINPELLKIAVERCPKVEFYGADMVEFELGLRVDVVLCLFSAIGYVKTADRMTKALRNMVRHLKPGGVLLLEPWFTPDKWHPGRLHAVFVDQPDLKLARMTISQQRGQVSYHEDHFLISTPDGIQHFTEVHELGLFTHEEYLAALDANDLTVLYDPDGLTGRGLYIGLRPLE